jgi:DNA-binding MarR family transcriptional regulator
LQIICETNHLPDETPIDHSTAGQVLILLHALARLMGTNAERRLSAAGIEISRLQLGVLHMLNYAPQNLSDLSRRFSLDPSTMVPVIDSLERKGYVVRERDPQDRRRVRLLCTDAARQVMRQISYVDEDDPIYRAFVQLGAAEVAHLVDTLRQIILLQPNGAALLAEIDARHHASTQTILQHRPPTSGDEC